MMSKPPSTSGQPKNPSPTRGGDVRCTPGGRRRCAPCRRGPCTDALSWYQGRFELLNMSNDAAGADTLRHLFVLLIGLGMRESSGRYCEGRDTTADNVTADTAEAGLFQTSWNAHVASAMLPALFTAYSDGRDGFASVFSEGVTCGHGDWANYGDGQGEEFQKLSKACPAFAAEFAALGLRVLRKHWGPINARRGGVDDASQLPPEAGPGDRRRASGRLVGGKGAHSAFAPGAPHSIPTTWSPRDRCRRRIARAYSGSLGPVGLDAPGLHLGVTSVVASPSRR